ncbi:hypothetical protein MKL09_17100 [Methylobacterium sp. J-048]|uniref:hypothetical protein n=1 Tax=Methylobacterium sp. J-048 TaxID=2836635 RepID=UPI001FBA392A|nr:hypothetical protein [Methylobacterium sp. J-048]MCJ2058263.1 hypothetical protein [Methylobacterium sp. J-048]
MSGRNERRDRCADLDAFKTLLVVGMILAHVVQIVQAPIDTLAGCLSNLVNLISFSGFLFAFGWGTALSCCTARVRTLWDRLKGPAKILLAFYLSGIAHLVLIDGNGLSAARILSVVTLADLPGHSEFLASFFVLSLAMVGLGQWLGPVAKKPPFLLLGLAMSALFGCVQVNTLDLPWLRILFGAPNNMYFPLAPYAMWLFLGAYHAGKPESFDRIALYVAALATWGFLAVAMMAGHPPSRFPPSTLWVMGSALFLLLYRAASMSIVRRFALPHLLTSPGRHILIYLVASNLALFACQNLFGHVIQNLWQAALVTAAMLIMIAAAIEAVSTATRTSRSLAPAAQT